MRYNKNMSDQYPPFRFDKREILVIFSLFVFVSLLMFTVGIVVGKGLTQIKYEKTISGLEKPLNDSSNEMQPLDKLSNNIPHEESKTESSITTTTKNSEEEVDPELEENTKTNLVNNSDDKTPLELIPKEKTPLNSLREPSQETNTLLDNPKIKALIEKEPLQQKERKVAAVDIVIPKSFPNGPFTVQVGSYTTKKEAIERIEHLKTLGFPHAYMSVKNIGAEGPTMYRVWLGYFSSAEEAKNGGIALQKRKEISSFIVKKAETPTMK